MVPHTHSFASLLLNMQLIFCTEIFALNVQVTPLHLWLHLLFLSSSDISVLFFTLRSIVKCVCIVANGITGHEFKSFM